jgi:hypothetical protein
VDSVHLAKGFLDEALSFVRHAFYLSKMPCATRSAAKARECPLSKSSLLTTSACSVRARTILLISARVRSSSSALRRAISAT